MRIRRRPPFQSSTPSLVPDPFLQQTVPEEERKAIAVREEETKPIDGEDDEEEEEEGTTKEARSRTRRRGLLHPDGDPELNNTRQVLMEEKIQEQTLDPHVLSDKSCTTLHMQHVRASGRSPGAAAVLLKEEESNGGYSDEYLAMEDQEGRGEKRKKQTAPVLMEGSRCSRVNGRGWRCCQQTLVGYSLCEHHLGKGRLRRGSTSRSIGKTRDQLLLGVDDNGERKRGKMKKIETVTKARLISSFLDETDHAAAAIISSLALDNAKLDCRKWSATGK